MPLVIPPEIAHGKRPPRPPASPGTTFFVSGMYRNGGSTPPALVGRRDATAGFDGRIRLTDVRRMVR
ncbi:hypothetical protein DF029_12710 [Burkholderia cepacia]|nr:hypothetical protein DF029_12710 [Burkholderia cepacia]